jgi:hypothetical protein
MGSAYGHTTVTSPVGRNPAKFDQFFPDSFRRGKADGKRGNAASGDTSLEGCDGATAAAEGHVTNQYVLDEPIGEV